MNTLFISIVTLGLATMLWMPGKPAATLQSGSPAPMLDTVVPADSAINWEQMSKAERKQYMKEVVLPKLKPIMHAFDPDSAFKDVTCKTCHGMGARNGQFKMPNPELPKLPKTREGFEKLMKEKPRMMEFMGKTLKPSMASLLNMPQFDPKTGTGFGCGNCHTTAE